MLPIVYSLGAAIIVSLVSLVGIFFIFIRNKQLQKVTLSLVSFAIGGLLGDAFIHLIPESFTTFGFELIVSLLILSGILFFFIIEKVLRWRHCHDFHCHEDLKHLSLLNLVGDAVHNLIDGMLIAASFMISTQIGYATTLAILLHEIPQEIGDFGVYLHSGISIPKALKYNFISALASVLGVLITFLLGSRITNFSSYLIPVTAGGFIYLAASDLIPELHRHEAKLGQSLLQLTLIILGILLMSSLTFFE